MPGLLSRRTRQAQYRLRRELHRERRRFAPLLARYATIAHTHTDTQNSVAAPASLTVTMPTGALVTDIAILVINSGGGTTNGSYTAPSGWTLIGQVLDANTGSDHISTQTWWSLGNNANLTFTKSGNVVDLGWVIACFSGCDTVSPLDGTGTANSSTGATSLTTNAVTVNTPGAWHGIGVGDWNSGTFTATGFTVFASGTTHEEAALLYNTTPKAVGSTGTVVVNDSASGTGQVIIGIPFALKPALIAPGLVTGQAVKRAGYY